MTFTIPGAIESLGVSRLQNMDELQKGDMIVIPPESECPRLHVAVDTLRSWGLSISSNGACRMRDRTRYPTARMLFGTPTWQGYDAQDDKSHVLVVTDATHDTNSAYGKKIESDVTVVNANSMDDFKMVVKPPVYPLMTVKASLMDPLWPRKMSKRDYPETLRTTEDRNAYDMLMKLVGDSALPAFRKYRNAEDKNEYNVLPYFMSVVSRIFASPSECPEEIRKNMPSSMCLTYRSVSSDCYKAGELVIIRPNERFTDRDVHCHAYMPTDAYKSGMLSLVMSAKFVKNICKRGAVLIRSQGLNDAASQIMAHAVAKNMAERYRVIIEKSRMLAEGLMKELPKVEKIRESYEKAENSLKVGDAVISAMKKLF